MTYRNLQDEVIALRFDESKRSSVKSWLNIGYQFIWGYRDWSFKRVQGASATSTITNSIATISAPSDFAQVIALYSPTTGDRLRYLPPELWDPEYRTPLSLPSGIAGDFTVVDRTIYLGPAQAGTFNLAYRRRLTHTDGPSGLSMGGIMVNDSDTPIWPGEHDYALIFQAATYGETLLDGLSSADLMSQRDTCLQAMVRDLAGPQAPGIRVWGAADIDATDASVLGWWGSS